MFDLFSSWQPAEIWCQKCWRVDQLQSFPYVTNWQPRFTWVKRDFKWVKRDLLRTINIEMLLNMKVSQTNRIQEAGKWANLPHLRIAPDHTPSNYLTISSFSKNYLLHQVFLLLVSCYIGVFNKRRMLSSFWPWIAKRSLMESFKDKNRGNGKKRLNYDIS